MQVRGALIMVALVAAVFAGLAVIFPDRLRTLGTGEALGAFALTAAAAVLFGSGVFTRQQDGGDAPRSLGTGLRYGLIWAGILAVLLVGYTQRDTLAEFGRAVAGATSPATVREAGGTITLQRAIDGHFWARIEINGTPVRGMIDTGASRLALSARDAEAAGIDTSRLRYVVPVGTAVGDSLAAVTLVDRVEFGSLVLTDVPALVLPPQADTSLIGQDVLGRFAEMRTRGDTLELVR